MPKELFEMRSFHAGTITTPDQEDIPNEAASYSLNLDSVSEQGVLKGIPGDRTLSTSGTTRVYDIGLIKNGDNHGLARVRLDGSNLDADVIEDIYDSATQRDLGAIGTTTDYSETTMTMQNSNKEIHMGTGSTAARKPKWIGYVANDQFGTTQTLPVLEDAELSSPADVGQFYKLVADSQYVYAVAWKGSKIYKYDHTDNNSFVESKGGFGSISGLCLHSAAGYLFVFDNSIGTYGTLYKVQSSTLEIVETYTISGYGTAETALPETSDLVSDLVVTDPSGSPNLWMAIYRSSNMTGATSKILFTIALSGLTNGSTFIPLDKTFTMSSTTNEGYFTATPNVTTYKTSLARHGSTANDDEDSVVWTGNFNNVAIKVDSGQTTNTAYNVLVYVDKDASASDAFNTTNVKLVALAEYNSGSVSTRLNRACTGIHISYDGASYLFMSFKAGTDGVNNVLYATPGNVNVGNITWQSNPAAIKGVLNDSASGGSVTTGTQSSTLVPIGDTGSAHQLSMFSTQQLGISSQITLDDSDGDFNAVSIKDFAKVAIQTKSLAASGTIGQNDATTFQNYKVSFLYDGFQESPLSITPVQTVELDDEKYAIQVSVKVATTNLSKRISHVNLYRAEGTSTTPTTFYRLVKQIELDANWQDITSGAHQAIMGDHKEKTIVDSGTLLASYEAINNISEDLSTTTVHYGLSTQINGQHIVGDCYHSVIEDPENYLFKSKPGNFDQFDYTKDFLRLPEKPTALASFAGRIYAFSENSTYRINPEGFFIEDEFNGVGCIGKRAVTVTEYGMCFADENNIYLHDGRSPSPIAEPILTDENGLGWQQKSSNLTPMVAFDAKKRSFLIFFQAGSKLTPADEGSFGTQDSVFSAVWAYNWTRKRWDLFMFNSEGDEEAAFLPIDIINGKDGEVLVSKYKTDNTNFEVTRFMGGTSGNNYRKWYHRSKKINMGVATQKKVMYGIHWTGSTDGGTTRYRFEDGSWQSLNASTPTSFTGNLAARKQRSLQVEIRSNDTSSPKHQDEVSAVSVVFRRLPINQLAMEDT